MRNILIFLAFAVSLNTQTSAQTTSCDPNATVNTTGFEGTAFFNYGSQSRATSQKYRAAAAVGQTFTGYVDGLQHTTTLGFYSRFLLPPFAVAVTASQGELLDRIQITWEIDALGPSPTEGFNIYRDGVFLASVAGNIRNYNDFNVIAGKTYNYTVRGLNVFGEGSPGTALGFQVPNGVATGWVRTINGNPVPDALVSLSPMQGFSTKFGQFDGATAAADVATASHFLPTTDADWTLACWVKTTISATPSASYDIFRATGTGLAMRVNNSGAVAFVVPGATAGSTVTLISAAGAGGTNGVWHHVALTYGSGQYRMYLDGNLIDLDYGLPVLTSPSINFGAKTTSAGWVGGLDELRIYHRRLDELELQQALVGTASSLTPNLKYYWKMDEGAGEKTFDILNRSKIFFCGAIFDTDRPAVATSAVTNSDGYYRIEGVSYGTGTTFLATPKKDFYKHRALKFLKNESDRATLPDFAMPEKATLEIWANESETGNLNEMLVHKAFGTNQYFFVQNFNGIIYVNISGSSHAFGTFGTGYRHIAVTLERTPTSTKISVFNNGQPSGTPKVAPATTGLWAKSGSLWNVGCLSGVSGVPANGFGYFFGGLMDEIAIYDTILSQTKILEHAQNSRDPQEKHLAIYFPFDEGTGAKLNQAGSVLLGQTGATVGTEWTVNAPNQSTTPHVFSPVTRQVTLNPSVTSVDQVDFTDRSTVAISGFVRYANTDCFAKNVEILVNGQSYSPQILTDTTGKFVIDVEPGATFTLSPKFENHQFSPAFWDVTNVISPIAGVVFNDITTRDVVGKVAGGLCKKSIIMNPGTPQGTVCIVRARTLDGCFEKIVVVDNADGDYEFLDLPPLKMTVSVTEHSDPKIKTAFQVQGGVQLDLEKKDTVVDFLYFAPPEIVKIGGLDPFSQTCSTVVLEQGELETITLKVVENYAGGTCPLDTANFKILDGLADIVLDTQMTNGTLVYKSKIGSPNPVPPYLKTIQFVATTQSDDETDLVRQALVTGLRTKETTFTTQLPETPIMVLRDPPGDGSYSFLEKNETFCNNVSFSVETESMAGDGVAVDLIPDVDVVFGLGIPSIIINSETGNEVSFTTTFNSVNSNTLQVCRTLNERLATDDGQWVVGGAHGGDIFMGAGLNVQFGIADKVEFNPALCQPVASVTTFVSPLGIGTTYMYSEFHIVNNITRYLQLLANTSSDPSAVADYQQSLAKWQTILNENVAQKSAAKFRRNLSFSSGFEYSYAETSDTTNGSALTLGGGLTGKTETSVGIKINDAGVITKLITQNSAAYSNTAENSSQKGITTGFVLKDDDPGDAFTINVGMDSVYDTPVFNLITGQSSCPWEPGTAHRETPSMTFRDGSGAVALDVPSNEPAVFKLTLGNLSASNEDWVYVFKSFAETNPDGAVIKLNGAPASQPVYFTVPYGKSIPITITIERGPVEYDYDSLQIAFYSECEYARAIALALPRDRDPLLFSYLNLSAHFIKPCSEVEITSPEQNWVIFPDPITPTPDDVMRITVSGYDKSNSDFDKIRVQYRRSDGDGAWINIVAPSGTNPIQDNTGAILRDDLGKDFTQFFWDTDGLADGDYEIHAWAICSGDVADKPGFSQIIKGRIERQPPSLIGLPQPSDGVYQVGDEISFSFNKNINCQKINALDNVLLFDATTDLPIDIDITCKDNQIFLSPNFQNEFFENRILRAELHDIEDLVGNSAANPIDDAFDRFGWEFYVDRNELAWLTDSLGMTKFEDDTRTVTAKIHNRGGYPAPFEILEAPSWVRVVPNTGTLAPNEIREIRFEVDSVLPFGHWFDTIVLRTVTGQNPFFMGGDEGLPFGVRVVCRPPDWDFDPQNFTNSMNMILKLKVQNQFSNDPEDMVVAWLGNKVVGRSHLEFVPQTGEFLAFLTIYGEPTQVSAPLKLEIWDASACLRFGILQNNFTFQPDNIVGSPTAPQVIETSNFVLRDVPIGAGWNWLSFNLAFPNSSLNASLSSLLHPQNDLIKSQTQFSTFANGSGWVGSLANLENPKMYIFKADLADTLKMEGTILPPATTPISVTSGWNWIGYIPKYPLPINDALSSLNPTTGDLIKSQTEFVQFVSPSFGWVGNLKFMQAPRGYQIKLANGGTLVYPPQPQNRTLDGGRWTLDERGGDGSSLIPHSSSPFWTVDASKFEHSTTLIGMLKIGGANATTDKMELGAFVGSEIRGASQAIFVEPLDAYVFFLTAYSNKIGEQLNFKIFDAATGNVQVLNEKMEFAANQHQGSLDAPVPFSLKTSAAGEATFEQSFDIQPNSFRTETLFKFSLPHSQEVVLSVLDLNGKTISEERFLATAGLNTRHWRAEIGLESGVYFVRLETSDGVFVRKMILQK